MLEMKHRKIRDNKINKSYKNFELMSPYFNVPE